MINKIFTDYKTFKVKIKIVFETINEECTAKRKLNLLKQTKAAAIYAAKF